jgi:hypothetical protein
MWSRSAIGPDFEAARVGFVVADSLQLPLLRPVFLKGSRLTTFTALNVPIKFLASQTSPYAPQPIHFVQYSLGDAVPGEMDLRHVDPKCPGEGGHRKSVMRDRTMISSQPFKDPRDGS